MNKFLILFLFCNLIKGQNNKSTVDIEYTLEKYKNGYSFIANANLLVDEANQTSLFQLKKLIDISPKLEGDEAINFSTRKICEDQKEYYFNFKNKIFIGLLFDVSCDNKVLIQNKISLPKWKITNKYKIINGKKARLAIATICGRRWFAYYLENNLKKFGPWKIIGLNGLVIFAYDKEKVYKFSLKKIKKIKTTFSKPVYSKISTESNFVKKAIEENKSDLMEGVKNINPNFTEEMYKKLAPYETIDFIEKK